MPSVSLPGILPTTLRRSRRYLGGLALAALTLAVAGCNPAETTSHLGKVGTYGGNDALIPTTRAFAIVDMDTGYILEGKALNEKVQVGSLTKIATALVVQNWLDSTRTSTATQVPIPQSAFAFGGPNPLGLQPGDTMTIRDLLYAALMNSDNISAFALAELVGAGSGGNPQQGFVAQMNALAQQLGMTNTMFTNAAGLDSIGGREPYSTAADMARLTKAAIAKAGFRFAVSQVTRQVTITRGGQTFAYTLKNTNELLGHGNIDGVKTGLTRLAGGCVILSEEKSPKVWQEGSTFYRINRRLIVVVLGSSNRFGDGQQLISYGWSLHDPWIAGNRPMDQGRSL